MRNLLIQLHKYAGLFLGLILSISALSGSLLVFDRELDELLTPATVDFDPYDEWASFNLALENATAAVNNGTSPTRLMTGRHERAPHIIRFPTPPGEAGPLEARMDPGTGEVLALRQWGRTPVSWIYHLHMAFFAGSAGELVVGLMGFLMVFFCITGVIIWWPRAGRWRRALTLKRDAGAFRFFYDLHQMLGIYMLPVYFVVALSGMQLIWHDPAEHAVSTLLPVRETPSPVSSLPTNSAILPLTADEAAVVGQAQFPESRLMRLYVPASHTAVWRVTFVHPEERWTEFGAGTTVYLDQYSGEVLDIWNTRDLPAGSTMLEWSFPLHNGDALGIVGRLIVLLSGLLIPILFGSGTYLWWRKRNPKPVASGPA
ncbi:MAG: hypothetical protein DHS20C12_23000 [Pseudohongiella sp.]|nr:MAG: hypothetical protein DHS20C12_23000 [Pseudohongiella sp.]